jgi:threonine dehydrogenase-like Zn-dependent dehydrogenase
MRVKSRFGAAKTGSEMSGFKGYGNPRGGYDDEWKVFRSDRPMLSFPMLLGNTCVGEIIEVGEGVTQFEVGQTVFRHSPFREEHVWPAKSVWNLPDGVSWKAAVCLDPVDFAVGAIRDGNVRLGDAVAVFGMGAIGLIAVQLAKLAGAYPVIAVDPLPIRREVASQVGADLVLDPTDCDAGVEVKKATGKRGADVCIEYSGSHLGLQAALRAVAYNSVVVAGAWPGAYPAGLDLGAEAHFNRPKIVFSRACSEPNPEYPNWDEPRLFDVAWRILSGNMLNTEAIVRPIVQFDDLLVEYPKIANTPEENVKLGVIF